MFFSRNFLPRGTTEIKILYGQMEKDSWEFHINFTTLDLYTDMKSLIILYAEIFRSYTHMYSSCVSNFDFVQKHFKFFYILHINSAIVSFQFSTTHLSGLSKHIVAFTYFSSVMHFCESSLSHLLVKSHILICHFFASERKLLKNILSKKNI